MDAHRHRYRRIDRRDLLERDQIGQCIEPEPLVLLRDHHPEEPQLAELRDQRWLEIRVAIPGLGVWRKLLAREVPCNTLDVALVFGERSEGPSHRWIGGLVDWWIGAVRRAGVSASGSQGTHPPVHQPTNPLLSKQRTRASSSAPASQPQHMSSATDTAGTSDRQSPRGGRP